MGYRQFHGPQHLGICRKNGSGRGAERLLSASGPSRTDAVVAAMHIGLVADIHGNGPALRAVLKAMPAVDLLLCAGDVVGYYPDVNEVCDLLRESNAQVVRGNHDAYVLGILAPDPAKKEAYRTDWTQGAMTRSNLDWLATLPVERRFEADGCRIILRHASPWDEETYLYRESPAALRVLLREEEMLVVGHTHIPMELTVGVGRIVNPGSVGQPRDYDPRSACAVLDSVTGKLDILRCSYDVETYQRKLEGQGWALPAVRILSRKRGAS